jgi:hypothetical protein
MRLRQPPSKEGSKHRNHKNKSDTVARLASGGLGVWWVGFSPPI